MFSHRDVQQAHFTVGFFIGKIFFWLEAGK
jgi:hypothetical protein